MPLPDKSVIESRERIHQRQRLRKGTFSCWECKKRKKRCEFDHGSNAACVFCRFRGLQCLSQESEESCDDAAFSSRHSLERVEALVDKLIQRRSRQSELAGYQGGNIDGRLSLLKSAKRKNFSEDASNILRIEPSRPLPGTESILSRCSLLGEYLHEFLPAERVALDILQRGRSPYATIQHSVQSQQSLQLRNKFLSPLNATPVLFARKLIQLAICLRQVEADRSEVEDLCLTRSALETARRYIDAAHQVTAQDALICSIDGLETLLLEGYYEVAIDNIETAWYTFRRALGMAQVIGLPQMSGHRAGTLWFRLLQVNRFLSMMLGFPASLENTHVDTERFLSIENAAQRLEREQVIICGRIISQNLQMKYIRLSEIVNETGHDHLEETQSIDHDIKQATKALPASWWRLPAPTSLVTFDEKAEATGRLIIQSHQHYLLLLLHMPYLISDCERPIPAFKSSYSHGIQGHTYNKLTTVTASRQELAIFLFLMQLDFVPSSHFGVVHKVFIAAVALLLAHIDGHNLGNISSLEHQRPQDVLMIEDVIMNLERIICQADQSKGCRDLAALKRLAGAESEAELGIKYVVQRTEDLHEPTFWGNRGINFQFPYIGKFYVVRLESLEDHVQEFTAFIDAEERLPETLICDGD